MFKVYLSESQWSRVCALDADVCAAVAEQQPELFERIHADKPTDSTTDETETEVDDETENESA